MSGEFRISMGVAFLRDHWQHTMSPEELTIEGNYIRRKRYPRELLKGVIFYADMDNKELERKNLELMSSLNFPCWPNPNALLNMLDRHKVLAECIKLGFVNHHVIQTNNLSGKLLNYPFVLKMGNSHRGIGKYLIKSKDDLPKDNSEIVTIEPFFRGASVRILIIDEYAFGIRITNTNSWIANSSGAETETFTPNDAIIRHARAVAKVFNLDFAGVDYIVEDDDNFHFLEINQYPGLDISDEAEPLIKNALNKKLQLIEELAK